MRTADFDFELPRQLIALQPSEKRDCSRLLILHRDGSVEHKRFFDIIDYLREGDMVLMNNTKVFPARLTGEKAGGKKVDILLVRKTDDETTWEILCKGSCNGPVSVFGGTEAEIQTRRSKKTGEKRRYLRIPEVSSSEMDDLIWKYGFMPLPPYIRRMPENLDKQRYQTVYADQQGSLAAPTAGLHFTDELICKIRNKGVLVKFLTLHIGTGTFKPVRVECLEDHDMEAEYFDMNQHLMEEIELVKQKGGRLFAVGTTTTRTVEGIASGRCKVNMGEGGAIRGFTDIFIYPGYNFRVVDCLVTNFHLPRSTPLLLVSAKSGFNKILKVYKEAAAMDYRFFSYGDAMLVL
jgi:S-adenosylmethionine:tRNA ribosyltransferase-isomerase